MMQQIRLPNGLTVSAVALGAMNFGTATPRDLSFRTLDTFLSVGGNFIDTSNNYAHWAGTGDESETLLGEWLRERRCRDRVVLATKVGFDRHGEGAGLRREQIVYWVEESLRKLGTDHIDLYYAHTDDPATPLEETMEAFSLLVRQGKVLTLGGSNYDTWRFAAANQTANEIGGVPFSVMQQRFSYLYPRADIAPKYRFNDYTTRERLRYLAANNIPLVAYSCLCRGGYERDDLLPPDLVGGSRLAFIRRAAREKGVSPSALVVAWLSGLHRLEGYPRVIPLFAASPENLLANLRGLELDLTEAELADLTAAV